MADPQQSANENSEADEATEANEEVVNEAGPAPNVLPSGDAGEASAQPRPHAEEHAARPSSPAHERNYERDYYGEDSFDRAYGAPSSASPLDTLEQNASLGIELGRFWIAQNLTTSLLGAFATGVFLGYMLRR